MEIGTPLKPSQKRIEIPIRRLIQKVSLKRNSQISEYRKHISPLLNRNNSSYFKKEEWNHSRILPNINSRNNSPRLIWLTENNNIPLSSRLKKIQLDIIHSNDKKNTFDNNNNNNNNNNTKKKQNLFKQSKSTSPTVLRSCLRKPYRRGTEEVKLPEIKNRMLRHNPKKKRVCFNLVIETSDISKGNDIRNGGINAVQEDVFYSSEKGKYDGNLKDIFIQSYPGENEDGYLKANEDSYLYYNKDGVTVLGLFDGHGMNGKGVSNYISKEILETISNDFTGDDTVVTYNKWSRDNQNYLYSWNKTWNEGLKWEKFSILYSGSTCLLCFHISKHLIVSNTGDSVCFIHKGNDSNVFLNNKHNVNNKQEIERIEKSGGEVCQKDDNGLSIWMKNRNYPGWKVSRTIGDDWSKSIGIIYEPEIVHYQIQGNEKFLVWGSSCLFEWWSMNEINTVINKYYNNRDGKSATIEVIKQAKKNAKASHRFGRILR